RRLSLRVRIARGPRPGAARHLHDPSPGARRGGVRVGRAPAGPAPLLPRARRAAAAAGQDRSVVRLVTWNIHGGFGRGGRHDPSRVAAVLEGMGCDLAAVQGGGGHGRHPGAELADHAAWLGRRLGWFVAYGPNLVLRGHPYGNAVLSRFPIAHARNYDLSIAKREPRGCLRVDLSLPEGRSLHLFDLHLGLSGVERRRQAAMLFSADLLRDTALPPPLVLSCAFYICSPLP